MDVQDWTLNQLLELDGIRFVIDETLGLWVKFDVKEVHPKTRKQGIKYSLTMHDGKNYRLVGFDNAHAIEYGTKNKVAKKRTFDHWHYDHNDKGTPYFYESAGKLLEDFWKEVDKRVNLLKELYNEKTHKSRRHAT